MAADPCADDAIGGYLPLELPHGGGMAPHLEGAATFQSGRAAFLALLQAVRPRRVWLPWYLCDSMAEPLAQAGIAGMRYGLDAQRMPQGVALGAGDLLVHVNHFGLCEDVQQRLAATFPREQLVFDNAQGFFAPPLPVLACIYSPRKFFGVPDGGFLVAPLVRIAEPDPDTGSTQRCAHLLLRHAVGAEAGYAAYCSAESGFPGQPPLRMSRLTQRLLAAIDYEAVRQRRRANFAQLAAQLDADNSLRLALPEQGAPLCYPFLAAREGLRQLLVQRRIYIPCYWPELLDGRPMPTRERDWAERLLPLPVDQRYDFATLADRLVKPLRQLLAA